MRGVVTQESERHYIVQSDIVRHREESPGEYYVNCHREQIREFQYCALLDLLMLDELTNCRVFGLVDRNYDDSEFGGFDVILQLQVLILLGE